VGILENGKKTNDKFQKTDKPKDKNFNSQYVF